MDRHLGDLHLTYKAVIDDNTLHPILANAFRLVHINVVDQFTEKRYCQGFHLHKPVNSGNEAVLVLALQVNFRKLLLGFGDFLFQLSRCSANRAYGYRAK